MCTKTCAVKSGPATSHFLRDHGVPVRGPNGRSPPSLGREPDLRVIPLANVRGGKRNEQGGKEEQEEWIKHSSHSTRPPPIGLGKAARQAARDHKPQVRRRKAGKSLNHRDRRDHGEKKTEGALKVAGPFFFDGKQESH